MRILKFVVALVVLCPMLLLPAWVARANEQVAPTDEPAPAHERELSPFAELSVTAHGAQRLDLATGFTELADGGVVVDRGSDVRLEAPWIRYLEGATIEATDAVVEGLFGQLLVPELVIDVLKRTLSAEGGVTLNTEVGVVRADEVLYEAEAGWLLARGGVVSDLPDVEAAGIWYHLPSARLVLLPPYLYREGPLTMRADADGGPLQLTPDLDEEGTLLGYDATTDLDDDVAARLLSADHE